MNKRHTPEQIIRKLRQADEKLAAGTSTPEVAKQLGVSEATLHRWRNQYGGMKADAMKRSKELEKENARLKKIVADQAVDISILKEVSRGNFQARPGGGRPSSTFDFEKLIAELEAYIEGAKLIDLQSLDERASTGIRSVDSAQAFALYEEFFRGAYGGTYHFLERLPDVVTDLPTGKFILSQLARAYDAAAEGWLEFGKVKEEEQTEVPRSVQNSYEAIRKYLVDFYNELKTFKEADGDEVKKFREDYGSFLYEIVLGAAGKPAEDYKPEITSTNEQWDSCRVEYDPEKHTNIRTKLELFGTFNRFEFFFRTAYDKVNRFKGWWSDHEIATYGRRRSPSVSDVLDEVRNRAKSGLDEAMDASTRLDWSFDSSTDDESSWAEILRRQQVEDTEHNVLIPVLEFNERLQEFEGLSKYKEEYQEFHSNLLKLHPSYQPGKFEQFPDPHGPSELEELREENQRLKEQTSRLQKENQKLKAQYAQFQRENQELKSLPRPDPAAAELNETMKRMEQREVEEQRRKRWERIREGNATFNDLRNRFE